MANYHFTGENRYKEMEGNNLLSVDGHCKILTEAFIEAHACTKIFSNIKMFETLFKTGIYFCGFKGKGCLHDKQLYLDNEY